MAGGPYLGQMGSLGRWVAEEAECAAVVVDGKCKLGSVARSEGRAVTKQLPHSKTQPTGGRIMSYHCSSAARGVEWVRRRGLVNLALYGKCKLGSVARSKGRAVTKQLPHNWGENNELPLLGVVWGANAGRAQALAAASASPPAPPPPWTPRPYLGLLVRRPSNACLAAPALHHLTAPLTAPLGQMGSLGRWVGTPCCTRQRSSAATAAALSSWPHFKYGSANTAAAIKS